MRISTGLAALSLVLSGASAMAQPADVPAGAGSVAPPSASAPASREVTSTGAVVPEVAPAGPRSGPDRTGSDVVSGLAVPETKDSAPAVRQ